MYEQGLMIYSNLSSIVTWSYSNKVQTESWDLIDAIITKLRVIMVAPDTTITTVEYCRVEKLFTTQDY